jgi:hypothetical protein
LAEHGFGVGADLLLNLLPLRRVDLFGAVFGEDLARAVADFGAQHPLYVVRPDGLMQLRHRVVLQPERMLIVVVRYAPSLEMAL